MLNLLRAELYRIFHKRSFYIYFGILALFYAMIVLMRISTADADSLGEDASRMFSLALPTLVGGYLFATLFNDDLNSKNLSTLIGFGLSKSRIVFSKLTMMLLMCLLLFGLTPLYMDLIYLLTGHPASLDSLASAYGDALSCLISTMVFTAVAAIVVYGLQRATFAIVVYILLAFGVVDQLIATIASWDLIANVLPNISQHLVTIDALTIQRGLSGGVDILRPVFECLAYLVASALAAIIVFNKKELEF